MFLPKYARLIEKNFPRTGTRCNLAAAMCETEKEFGTKYSSIAIAGTPAHLAFGLLRWDTALETSLVGYATSVQRPDGASDVVLNTVLLSDKVVSTKDQEVPTEWIHWEAIGGKAVFWQSVGSGLSSTIIACGFGFGVWAGLRLRAN
jgi:hypothetical protein